MLPGVSCACNLLCPLLEVGSRREKVWDMHASGWPRAGGLWKCKARQAHGALPDLPCPAPRGPLLSGDCSTSSPVKELCKPGPLFSPRSAFPVS